MLFEALLEAKRGSRKIFLYPSGGVIAKPLPCPGDSYRSQQQGFWRVYCSRRALLVSCLLIDLKPQIST